MGWEFFCWHALRLPFWGMYFTDVRVCLHESLGDAWMGTYNFAPGAAATVRIPHVYF